MTDEWLVAIDCDAIEDGDGVTVNIEDKEIAVFRCGQDYYATDSHCSHARAPLVDGYLDGTIIECPLHQGRFDIRSGKALCSPAIKDIVAYPTRVIDGRIQIRLGKP